MRNMGVMGTPSGERCVRRERRTLAVQLVEPAAPQLGHGARELLVVRVMRAALVVGACHLRQLDGRAA